MSQHDYDEWPRRERWGRHNEANEDWGRRGADWGKMAQEFAEGLFGPRGPLSTFGPFGPDGPMSGMFPGPKSSSGPRRGGKGRRGGDLNAAILHLLAESPMNGYTIMQSLSERTGGQWAPGSGAVYPALSELEDQGLVETYQENGRRAYRLTVEGRTRVAQSAGEPKPWESGSGDRDRSSRGEKAGMSMGFGSADLWRAYGNLALALRAVAPSNAALQTEALGILDDARKRLYRLLAEGGDQQSETGSDTTASQSTGRTSEAASPSGTGPASSGGYSSTGYASGTGYTGSGYTPGPSGQQEPPADESFHV